jgi:hypothetical protein
MKTIEELIHEEATLERLLKQRLLTVNGVIGMGIGYLMEKAGIPDFTQEGYDPKSKKCLGDYVEKLQEALPRINDYFQIVAKQDAATAQEAANMFLPVLQANLDELPGHLADAFRFHVLERDTAKKVEFQLMEIVMYSRIGDASNRSIVGRVGKIDPDTVPEELRPVYEKACKYFKPE